MPAVTKSAPGKIILFGEHAVVYGRPAIAVPVNQVKARVIVMANPESDPGVVWVLAPDIEINLLLNDLSREHPLSIAVDQVLKSFGIKRLPACTIKITSTIPIAGGLGSGAAITVALIRALSAFLGQSISDEQVCESTFEVEKYFHGSPSGIDNTVITYERPVYYQKGEPIEFIEIPKSLWFVIGDTGISSPTSMTVSDVRKAWNSKTAYYENVFDQIGEITVQAKNKVKSGYFTDLGSLMEANHICLQRIGVSSKELDILVTAAIEAGAIGAKMSGGGRGGNMIALVHANQVSQVAQSLIDRGATNTIITEVYPTRI